MLNCYISFFCGQHYAKAGFSTCLVTHSQDLVAEYLLKQRIGTDPIVCCDNLSAVRLETTKVCVYSSFVFGFPLN